MEDVTTNLACVNGPKSCLLREVDEADVLDVDGGSVEIIDQVWQPFLKKEQHYLLAKVFNKSFFPIDQGPVL